MQADRPDVTAETTNIFQVSDRNAWLGPKRSGAFLCAQTLEALIFSGISVFPCRLPVYEFVAAESSESHNIQRKATQ